MNSFLKYITHLAVMLLCLVTSSTLVYASDDADLHIHNPWIREAPPNTKILAAYMIIENHADKSFTITGASSPAFKKIEIHQSSTDGDMMRMEKKPELKINAKQRLVLEPGNIHLMLFNPEKILKHGDTVEIVFKLKNGDTLKANTKVKKVIGSMRSHNKSKNDSHKQHSH